jgi:hypothetical protein
VKAREIAKNTERDVCYGCRPDEWGDDSGRVWAAVEESVKRFVKMNQENIVRSDKEKIASASYSGGMIDMIMVIKCALGNWAVGQLVSEIEKWHRTDQESDVEDEEPEDEISQKGVPGPEGISQEDAKDLGERIASWMADQQKGSKGQLRDPMFA